MKHPERDEQIAFFRWSETVRYKDEKLRSYLYSVPNELPFSGKRAMLAMIMLRAAGLTKGAFDVECMIASLPYTGLHIEFKAPKPAKSKVSDEQIEMQRMLDKCGRKTVIVYSFEEARAALGVYLGKKL